MEFHLIPGKSENSTTFNKGTRENRAKPGQLKVKCNRFTESCGWTPRVSGEALLRLRENKTQKCLYPGHKKQSLQRLPTFPALHEACQHWRKEDNGEETAFVSMCYHILKCVSLLLHRNNFLGKNAPCWSNSLVSGWGFLLVCSTFGTLSLPSRCKKHEDKKNGESKLDRCTTKECTKKPEWLYKMQTVLFSTQLKSALFIMMFLQLMK